MEIAATGHKHPGRLSSDTCGDPWIYHPQAETASAEELRAEAESAWQTQWSSLLKRSGFYRRKFAEAGISEGDIRGLADLIKLPFTTKLELRENATANPPFGDYLSVDPSRIKRIYQTSGTTGVPSLLALTERDLHDEWGNIALRTYYGTGYHPHNRVATNFGAGPFVAGAVHRILERIGCRTVPIAPGDTDRLLRSMRMGLVDSLHGTPSFMLHLASRIERDALRPEDLGIVHISVGGEPGGGIPAIRQKIETSFGCEVTEVMGLGDIAASLFGECPVRGGMHFSGQGHVWMELRDPNTGNIVDIKPGAEGEPVYTHLTREAMPLVRFRSGDHVVVQDDDCQCGRTSFRIRCVGRVDDMFIVRGVNVYPSAVQSVVAEFEPTVTGRSRVALPSPNVSVTPPVRVEVEVPNDTTPSDELRSRIEAAIRERLIFRADVQWVPEAAFGSSGYKTAGIARVGRD